ncbi:hypothetical protein PRIPAC_94424 [Pristionchus pacificus]|uniref:Uncharacterized protein n=1 Tax=Pristionchus pacificus TaxID=54126 RepID=A0A2A6BPB5_PRIPA|nr:hypothetical protein PRIPAC_94424 [Pristionchus pacificus]|eukprot:PDM67678.1 hypothetical protein PRIPAC_45722 [Pristionchus pacificus]
MLLQTNMLVQLTMVSVVVGSALSCAPTDPGTIPGGPGATTTTTLPPCCRTDIYKKASPDRALFNPALTACPDSANFICSVDTDLATSTTMIVINGGETIATGPNGMNSFATLTCNAQKKWTTASGTIVDSIAMRSLLHFTTVSVFFGLTRPCAPTHPGTVPGLQRLTTTCEYFLLRVDIFVKSSS